MQVQIFPSRLHGKVSAPPSKSMAHRLLISAGLSQGRSVIRGIALSQDVLATIDCLQALGANCQIDGDTVTVTGVCARHANPSKALPCRESGSTLRFLIPIALLSGNTVTLVGAPSLLGRPMGIYQALCKEKGLSFSQTEQGITVGGRLPSGIYELAGNVSSQFVSGLMLALPLVQGDSEIRLIPPVESRSYIELTRAAQRAYGVLVEWKDACTLTVRGGQTYRSTDSCVEGDYSNAAFLDALAIMGNDVTVCGLCMDSLQGDRVYKDFFEQIKQGSPTLSLADCPDLGPILFVVAAAMNGATFTDTARLRIKESDRVACMKQELEKFGARLLVEKNTVTVLPAKLHTPSEPLCSHNDHRIAMSLAVLATRYGGSITGAEAVAKSYPDFFEQLERLGAKISMGRDPK